MKLIRKTLEDVQTAYPLEQLAPREQLLFFDIETTGFSAAVSQLYLIGCAYWRQGSFHFIQWLAERRDEEALLLTEFFQFAKSFQVLVHFNGSTFDLPYLTRKCGQLSLPCPLERFQGIDLYKRISPFQYLLKLPNCKQRTLEVFLGNDRKDPFNGGELIAIYQEYLKTPTRTAEETLLLHNEDDLRGMLSLLPLLAYYDMFQNKVVVKKAQANYYRDLNGDNKKELIMTLQLPTPLPKPVSASANNCYFNGQDAEGRLRVPIYEEELKYFYSNYQDYYYLPSEDIALHKSVAHFVDKAHRVQATASTCYTRKQSQYLPQWGVCMKPFLKRDYKSRELFFELTEDLKHNRQAFTDYANHVLEMLISAY